VLNFTWNKQAREHREEQRRKISKRKETQEDCTVMTTRVQSKHNSLKLNAAGYNPNIPGHALAAVTAAVVDVVAGHLALAAAPGHAAALAVVDPNSCGTCSRGSKQQRQRSVSLDGEGSRWSWAAAAAAGMGGGSGDRH
jgi:hypothetical protein